MKEKKLMYIVLPILCFVAIIISYIKIVNTNNDALKFKKEYESLNGTTSKSGNKYNKLSIKDNNPIKYSNYDEVLNVIKKGTGVIYLGYPECPWCRSAIPVLFEVARDYNINTIYYLNIKDDRDSYVVEDGKLIYMKDDKGNDIKGTDGYFKLLKALDKYLTDYIITDNNKRYEVGEKRIYVPSIIFVKDGEILGIQVSTVESQKSGYDTLTDKESDELYSIYEKYITKLDGSTCSIGSSC